MAQSHPHVSSGNTGDTLRNFAAEILTTHYGQPKEEYREVGKKVDIYFEKEEFGYTERIYIEAKDYAKPLSRSDVVKICVDYEGILQHHGSRRLIIVTRNGLHTDARTYIEKERSNVRHQTISEIENASLNLNGYLRSLVEARSDSRLNEYYIEAGFRVRISGDSSLADLEELSKKAFDQGSSALSSIRSWLKSNDDHRPLAVLGGYGSGKTSVATLLSAELAERALNDPMSRQPIVLKLGEITHFSSIEGILGGHFTHTHPVPNFIYSNFANLNEKGRYVIFLDGFDEMKHAMSWQDFKQQIKTLLKLKSERAKIVLLGRPSSLISEDEERWVLKGQKRMKDAWVNLPEWPKFHEIELEDFSPVERRDFISRYLTTFLSGTVSDADRDARAALTNKIADANRELFKKPVHSKILTDLAVDPNFDLEQFQETFSRWDLYQSFIQAVYEREAEKVARREMPPEQRLQFLEDIAFWLWTDRDASTSFEIGQIPRSIRSSFPNTDDDGSGGVREMLTGSILEKKGYETYYFGHRSFAEFLVASRMYNRVPAANEHAQYAVAFVDGVKDFLIEAGSIPDVDDWIRTFSVAVGRINPSYILLLAESSGGMRNLKEALRVDCFWRGVLEPFAEDFSPNRANGDAVARALQVSSPLVFCWHLAWLLENGASRLDWQQSKFNQVVFSAILNRLFSAVTFKDRRMSIKEENATFKRLARICLTPFSFDTARRDEEKYELEMNLGNLSVALHDELTRGGVPWDGELGVSLPNVSFKIGDLKDSISGGVRENWRMFHKHIQSFPAIVEIGSKKGDERRIQKSNPFRKGYRTTGG